MGSTLRPCSIRFGAVLLAAGASTRMGTSKLLLPWGACSVLAHLLRIWKGLGAAQLGVVCAKRDALLQEEMDRLQVPQADRLLNPIPEQGMFSSILCAARHAGWSGELTHWALILGDQPHLPQATLQVLLQLVGDHPERVCQLSRRSRPRHPVILPKRVFAELAQSSHAHLKDFLSNRTEEVVLSESDDPALDLDLDTPSDYEMALRQFPPPAGP